MGLVVVFSYKIVIFIISTYSFVSCFTKCMFLLFIYTYYMAMHYVYVIVKMNYCVLS